MKMSARVAALALAAMVAGAAQAAAPNKNTKDALQRFVDRVESLGADFEQVQKDEGGKVTQSFTGKLWLSRPGKFRWEYQKPYAQLMTCDGKKVWMYDPDLAQVTVRPAASSLQGTPVQLLTDRASLDRQFKVESMPAEGLMKRLKLTPVKPESDFRSVQLWLLDGVPQRMVFEDPLGGVNEVTFSAIKLNQKYEDGFFSFKAPEGTEVIETQAESPIPAGTPAPNPAK